VSAAAGEATRKGAAGLPPDIVLEARWHKSPDVAMRSD
jgi:hypothetical protein